jgi:hypothetical protein
LLLGLLVGCVPRQRLRALDQAGQFGVVGAEHLRALERAHRARWIAALEQDLAEPAKCFRVLRVDLRGLEQRRLGTAEVAIHVPSSPLEHEQAPLLLLVIDLDADQNAARVAIALRRDQILRQRIRILVLRTRPKAQQARVQGMGVGARTHVDSYA